MIKSFKNKDAEKIFDGQYSKKYSNLQNIIKRKLDMIHFAHSKQDLIVPPSNRFENLQGDLKEYYSIRINDQYRIIFQFKDGNAENVYIDDYH
ncbi:type II toxin-antitoxin system RelE/ParE family toxin [bacterium]|nr:type II toxin-antitoxin system RelE/ParE family toxin [bacterium]